MEPDGGEEDRGRGRREETRRERAGRMARGFRPQPEVFLDLLGSRRRIWRGHLSNCDWRYRETDKGLMRAQRWAARQAGPQRASSETPPSRPATSQAEPLQQKAAPRKRPALRGSAATSQDEVGGGKNLSTERYR